jgi:hypothetical protein
LGFFCRDLTTNVGADSARILGLTGAHESPALRRKKKVADFGTLNITRKSAFTSQQIKPNFYL